MSERSWGTKIGRRGVPIPVSREVSSVPGLETPVEFQLAGAGDGRSLVSRLRWALSRAKEEIGLSADIRESRICESPSSAIVQSAMADYRKPLTMGTLKDERRDWVKRRYT